MAVLSRIALDVVAELDNRAHLAARQIGDGAHILAIQARGGGKNIGVFRDGYYGCFDESVASHCSFLLRMRFCGISGEDLVQRRDGGVNMNALEDVRRQKAQRRIAGAVDDDAVLKHLGDGVLAQIGGVEFGSDHQALAAHLGDARVALGQLAQLLLEVLANLRDMIEQVFLFDVINHGSRDGAGKRTAAKGGAVHSRMEGARHLVGAERRAHRNAAGQAAWPAW